uniref:Ig-like domain-containing protein n=1 Tax=Labrus bergylta TaxID=56723 RepID=A0A3Q3E441_9LABR
MMLFFVNLCLLWTLCVAQLDDMSQPVSFQTVKLGESASIECHIKSETHKRVWYKLNTWRSLQLVAQFNTNYNKSQIADTFHQRYSDTGTYFCGVLYLNDVRFGSGTFLMLKGANMISDSIVQQPGSQTVQLGDSVTLSCSVNTGHCAGEHTGVMWLKNSGAQIISSSGYKNHSCDRTESGQTTCVYTLLMRNIRYDDEGMYYCDVTLCGHMLSGNGTRININNTKPVALSPAVIALILSNIALGIVTLVLLWKFYTSRRNNSTGYDGVLYEFESSASEILQRTPEEKTSVDSVVYSDVRYCQKNRKPCFSNTEKHVQISNM